MRLLATAALLAATLALPTSAFAGRFTAGVSLGRTQAEVDADQDLDASSTASLWFRVGIGRKFSAELEYGKIATEDNVNQIRSTTLLGRYAVTALRGGTLRPMLLLGFGFDTASTPDEYTHAEFGAALELDVAKDFLVGADFRFGDRVNHTVYDAQPVDGGPAFLAPTYLAAGGYRTGRLYLGVRF